MEVNDNDGQIVANDSEDVTANACCRANIELDCATEVLEQDKPDEVDEADEHRPPKKTKCLADDTCSASPNG